MPPLCFSYLPICILHIYTYHISVGHWFCAIYITPSYTGSVLRSRTVLCAACSCRYIAVCNMRPRLSALDSSACLLHPHAVCVLLDFSALSACLPASGFPAAVLCLYGLLDLAPCACRASFFVLQPAALFLCCSATITHMLTVCTTTFLLLPAFGFI